MFSPFCLLQRADSGGEGGDETGGVDVEGYVDAGCVGVDQSGGIADGSASGAVEIAGFEFDFHWQINAGH